MNDHITVEQLTSLGTIMMTTIFVAAVGALSAAAAAAPADNPAVNDLVFPVAARQGMTPAHGSVFSDDQLREMGHVVCDGVDQGVSKFRAAQLLVDNVNASTPDQVPMEIGEAGYFVGVAVAAYCPAHNDDPMA